MKLYEFSEESIEYAKALDLLGFDIVTRTEPTHISVNGKLLAESINRKCELPYNYFPEIESGISISISYIINHEMINEIYSKPPFNYGEENKPKTYYQIENPYS